jgi:general secretion pathway protein F
MKVRFEAFNFAGDTISGEVEAASLDEAREIIRARGATPYAVRTARAPNILLRNMGSGRGVAKVSDSELARLMRDIAVLLASGVSLDVTLRIASATSDLPRMRDVTLRMLEGVLGGSSLAESMEQMHGMFRPEYVRIIQAGEMGANLATATEDLADLLDRRVEIRAKVRAAMAYPLLLIALACVSLWVVLGLLIPAVTPIFLENGKPLPNVLWVLNEIRQYAGLALGLMAAFGAALALAVVQGRRQPAICRLIDRVYLSVPIVGRISETREAARFTRTLASLVKAGVAPLQALQAACPLVKNTHTRACLESAVADVRAGATIGTSMTKTAALPPVARQMIAVGEESGRLQEMLFRAAGILERQEQLLTARTVTVLTPALTILVSGVIAAIILSVMSAILSINDLALQ